MLKTTQPTISVIVPIYKVERFLPKCLDSILAQTYKNLEIILVDDGSPDRCGEICEEYAKKDSRVRVVHQTNQGLPSARNSGLKIAQGQYIGFVDSDDYIDPDMYEYLYHLITKDNAAIAMCNFCEDEGARSANPIKKCYEVKPFQQLFELADWMYVWNKLYTRASIGNLLFNPALIFGEDLGFMFEMAKKNLPVALGNEAKYHYRRNQNSNSATNTFHPGYQNKIILGEQWLAYAKEHGWTVFYKTRRSAQFRHVCYFLALLAKSPSPDANSVRFLTGNIKQHFFRFVCAPGVPLRDKLFGVTACVSFNLARKIALVYYKRKKERFPAA